MRPTKIAFAACLSLGILPATIGHTRPGDAEREAKKKADTLATCDALSDGQLKGICRAVVVVDIKKGGCDKGKYTQTSCGKKIVGNLNKAIRYGEKACSKLGAKDAKACTKTISSCLTSYKRNPSSDVVDCALNAGAKNDSCKDPSFKSEGQAVREKLGVCQNIPYNIGWGNSSEVDGFARAQNAAKAGLKTLAVYDKKWASCLSNPKVRSVIGSSDRRSWGECLANYENRWKVPYDQTMLSYNKSLTNISSHESSKQWGQAISEVENQIKKITEFGAAAEKVGSAAQKSEMSAAKSKLTAKHKQFIAAQLAALMAKPCPSGKNRNKGLEKKLGKVFTVWGKSHAAGKTKLKQIRMNGPIVKEVLVSGKRETANTIVCYEKPHVKTSPRCHYDWLSFERTKGTRGGWSAWTRGGAGENGPLYCKNVKN